MKVFNPEEVKGYNNLDDKEKEVFKRFCARFYKAWEYPEDHAPLKIQRARKYLRVTLNDGDWLHILKNGEWYQIWKN